MPGSATHHSYMHQALEAGFLSSLHRSTTASTPPWHALNAPWQPTSSACRAASSVLESTCLWSMAVMSSLRRSRGARKDSGCSQLQQQNQPVTCKVTVLATAAMTVATEPRLCCSCHQHNLSLPKPSSASACGSRLQACFSHQTAVASDAPARKASMVSNSLKARPLQTWLRGSSNAGTKRQSHGGSQAEVRANLRGACAAQVHP